MPTEKMVAATTKKSSCWIREATRLSWGSFSSVKWKTRCDCREERSGELKEDSQESKPRSMQKDEKGQSVIELRRSVGRQAIRESYSLEWCFLKSNFLKSKWNVRSQRGCNRTQVWLPTASKPGLERLVLMLRKAVLFRWQQPGRWGTLLSKCILASQVSWLVYPGELWGKGY